MNLQGVTLSDFRQAVAATSPRYGDNLRVHQDAHQKGIRKFTTVGRLTVASSRGTGARRSSSGRLCQAACWHSFRDTIREIFVMCPDAVVTTTLARYTAANFEATYRATGWVNIGSQFAPVTMPELCEC